MTDIILGITCIILGAILILQQIQLAQLRRNVFKLDDILLDTMKEQHLLMQMVRGVEEDG